MTDCGPFDDCPEPTVDETMETMEDGDMMDDEMMMEEDHTGWWKEEKPDPFMGQIAFTMLALGNATGIALDLFRYEKDTVYTYGDELRWFNSWKIYKMVEQYGGLTLWSVAAITQILSFAGIAVDINIMVWLYGVMMGGMWLSGLVGLLQFIAYDSAYALSQETGTDVASLKKKGTGVALMPEIENDMLMTSAMETATTLAIWAEFNNWMAGQWSALPKETRDQWLAEMNGEDAEGAMEEEVEEEETVEEEPVEVDPFALFEF